MPDRIMVQLWPDGAARLIEELTLRVSQMTSAEKALRDRTLLLTDEIRNLKQDKQELTDQLNQLAAALVEPRTSDD